MQNNSTYAACTDADDTKCVLTCLTHSETCLTFVVEGFVSGLSGAARAEVREASLIRGEFRIRERPVAVAQGVLRPVAREYETRLCLTEDTPWS